MKFVLRILILGILLSPLGLRAQDTLAFELPDINGRSVDLADYAGKKAVVLIFTGNHCVYSKKYEERIIKLAKSYDTTRVAFLLINSNDPLQNESESRSVSRQRAEAQAYPFPYLMDSLQWVAQQLGAERSPEAYLLDPAKGFQVMYSGAIDDNPMLAAEVGRQYLREAIDAQLAGKGPLKVQRQPPIGCRIRPRISE